ncbi:hypothetical protein OCU04_012524 [Sclerotinia nivalis]|uniref:Uncharacterized protein n=1 Tax=Sclerotinia nivalis TaxID=352851 RepID=A0A9X0A939_9HELO|nr:hypothetical protein OCU04_012524 [Sclerotinia nivalis]
MAFHISTYNIYSPRLRRTIVLCAISLIVALFLSDTDFRKSRTVQTGGKRVFERSSPISNQGSYDTFDRISKRVPVKHEAWNKAIESGKALLCSLKAKRAWDYPLQSRWLDLADLMDNGVRTRFLR